MISRETFESHLKGILDGPKCVKPLKDLWAKYQLAQSNLPKEVLAWIPKAEPNLSDHGILHIDNVLENAARLLNLDPDHDLYENNGKIPFNDVDITPVEAFVLGMALLFHDTGNILKRQGHARTGREVMCDLTKGILIQNEIRYIDQVMSAHSGLAKNGSPDTIHGLSDVYVCGELVRLRQLAAVVRFADELAEGPQRTSNLLRKKGAFVETCVQEPNDKPKRNQYHDFASITNINIDSGNGRIAIRYDIDLNDNMFENSENGGREQLKSLLQMIFGRIRKTDDERRYARYYGGKLLANFHTTDVIIQFHRDGNDIETGLNPIVINDLVVPNHSNDSSKDQDWISQKDKEYDIEKLLTKVWT